MNFTEEILAELKSQGYCQPDIERALDLPMGTLTNNAEDPETIALMKIVKTYPWMIEVADRGYDENTSNELMLDQAIEILEIMKVENSDMKDLPLLIGQLQSEKAKKKLEERLKTGA